MSNKYDKRATFDHYHKKKYGASFDEYNKNYGASYSSRKLAESVFDNSEDIEGFAKELDKQGYKPGSNLKDNLEILTKSYLRKKYKDKTGEKLKDTTFNMDRKKDYDKAGIDSTSPQKAVNKKVANELKTRKISNAESFKEGYGELGTTIENAHYNFMNKIFEEDEISKETGKNQVEKARQERQKRSKTENPLAYGLGKTAFELPLYAITGKGAEKVLGKFGQTFLGRMAAGQLADTIIRTPATVLNSYSEGKDVKGVLKDVGMQQLEDLTYNLLGETVGLGLKKVVKTFTEGDKATFNKIIRKMYENPDVIDEVDKKWLDSKKIGAEKISKALDKLDVKVRKKLAKANRDEVIDIVKNLKEQGTLTDEQFKAIKSMQIEDTEFKIDTDTGEILGESLVKDGKNVGKTTYDEDLELDFLLEQFNKNAKRTGNTTATSKFKKSAEELGGYTIENEGLYLQQTNELQAQASKDFIEMALKKGYTPEQLITHFGNKAERITSDENAILMTLFQSGDRKTKQYILDKIYKAAQDKGRALQMISAWKKDVFSEALSVKKYFDDIGRTGINNPITEEILDNVSQITNEFRKMPESTEKSLLQEGLRMFIFSKIPQNVLGKVANYRNVQALASVPKRTLDVFSNTLNLGRQVTLDTISGMFEKVFDKSSKFKEVGHVSAKMNWKDFLEGAKNTAKEIYTYHKAGIPYAKASKRMTDSNFISAYTGNKLNPFKAMSRGVDFMLNMSDAPIREGYIAGTTSALKNANETLDNKYYRQLKEDYDNYIQSIKERANIAIKSAKDTEKRTAIKNSTTKLLNKAEVDFTKAKQKLFEQQYKPLLRDNAEDVVFQRDTLPSKVVDYARSVGGDLKPHNNMNVRKGLTPFFRTRTNMAQQVIEMNPMYATVNAGVQSFRVPTKRVLTPKDKKYLLDSLSKATLSIGITAGGTAGARKLRDVLKDKDSKVSITSDGSDMTPEELQLEKALGWKPDSLKIEFNDTSYYVPLSDFSTFEYPIKDIASVVREDEKLKGYKGNIDLYNMPTYISEDGRDVSYFYAWNGKENKYILVPTTWKDENGNVTNAQTINEALQRYTSTGQHLGKYETQEEAQQMLNNISKYKKKSGKVNPFSLDTIGKYLKNSADSTTDMLLDTATGIVGLPNPKYYNDYDGESTALQMAGNGLGSFASGFVPRPIADLSKGLDKYQRDINYDNPIENIAANTPFRFTMPIKKNVLGENLENQNDIQRIWLNPFGAYKGIDNDLAETILEKGNGTNNVPDVSERLGKGVNKIYLDEGEREEVRTVMLKIYRDLLNGKDVEGIDKEFLKEFRTYPEAMKINIAKNISKELAEESYYYHVMSKGANQ